MNNLKILSIIIPTYNRPAELRQIIEKIQIEAMLIHDDIELIIGDNSDPVVQKKNHDVVLQHQDFLDIKYTANVSNLGFAANVYNAMQSSSADYTLLLSDDDDLYVGSLELISNTLKSLKYSYPASRHIILCPYIRGGILSERSYSKRHISAFDFLVRFRSRLLLSSVIFPSASDSNELSSIPCEPRSNLYPHILMSSPARSSFSYMLLTQPLTIVGKSKNTRWSVYQVTSDLLAIMHNSSRSRFSWFSRKILYNYVVAWSLLLAVKYISGQVAGRIDVSELLRLAKLTRSKAFSLSFGFYPLALFLNIKENILRN